MQQHDALVDPGAGWIAPQELQAVDFQREALQPDQDPDEDALVPADQPAQARLGERGLQVHADELGLHVGDRKSTRLNSSHLVISYAVFCLKKKKLPTTQ